MPRDACEIAAQLAVGSDKGANHPAAESVRATAFVQILGFIHLTDTDYITDTTACGQCKKRSPALALLMSLV
ncbi:hypothetical protein [uncultured Microbulbifer sp.]|uniref:hypothetical protein n=1 Tax=uncultured Microbulbifer sp. TaxID=348147 RepID=UPI00261C9471|nr:hypothetical protein [uncultured Microbulbifer sp.]